MTKLRVANKSARKYVMHKEEFTGSNTLGYWQHRSGYKSMYIVRSYGPHFPIYVFTEGMWFGNEDKYSASTSRHQSQLRPLGEVITWLGTADMRRLVNAGSWTQFCALKLTQ